MPERPAPTISTSRCSEVHSSLPRLRPAPARSTRKAMPAPLQPCEKRVTHRRRGSHLAGARRQLVEGEAEAGLGEHLRGLAVAGVAAGDLGDDPLAAALADEADLEPAARALRLARALARALSTRSSSLRAGGSGASRATAPTPPAQRRDRRQVLGDEVVAVGEVGAVALERGGGAADDGAVDGRQRRRPAAELGGRGGSAARRRVDLAAGGARLGAAALLWRRRASAGRGRSR